MKAFRRHFFITTFIVCMLLSMIVPIKAEALVSNFDQLKEAIDDGETHIVLTGNLYTFTEMLQINGEVTLTTQNDSSEVFFVRDEDFTGMFFKITETGTLYLGLNDEDIALTIDGENLSSDSMIHTKGKLIINGANLINNNVGASTSTGGIVAEGTSAEIVLNNGTIKNHAAGYGAIYGDNSSIVINGGSINNNTSELWYRAGAINVDNGATLLFAGGDISYNTGGVGGILIGHVLYYDVEGQRSILNEDDLRQIAGNKSSARMTGGSINNNTGTYFAGGVFISGNAEFTMDGGDISYNISNQDAGGILAFDWIIWQYAGNEEAANDRPLVTVEKWSEIFPAAFTMNGGLIKGNRALGNSGDGDGGGLLIKSNNITLNAGTFSDNYAKKHGGAIHLKTVPYQLKLTNLAIYENNSNDEGGGIWLCPIGDAVMSIEDGVIIYNNTAQNAGDEIYTKAKEIDYFNVTPVDHYFVTLPSRFPDGMPIKWYKDNHSDRYQIGDPEILTQEYENTEYGLKANVDVASAQESSQKSALIITNNTAGEGGGGIGSNGYLELGESEPLTNITFKKKWTGGLTKREIVVKLLLNNKELGEFTLNEGNNYSAEIKNLPTKIRVNGQLVSVYEAIEFIEKDLPIGTVFSQGEFRFERQWIETIESENGNHSFDRLYTLYSIELYNRPTGDIPETGKNINLSFWLTISSLSFLAIICFTYSKKHFSNN